MRDSGAMSAARVFRRKRITSAKRSQACSNKSEYIKRDALWRLFFTVKPPRIRRLYPCLESNQKRMKRQRFGFRKSDSDSGIIGGVRKSHPPKRTARNFYGKLGLCEFAESASQIDRTHAEWRPTRSADISHALPLRIRIRAEARLRILCQALRRSAVQDSECIRRSRNSRARL